MHPPVVTIKSNSGFKNLAAFKKWAIAQLNTAIDKSTSVRECYECGQGRTCFKHGTAKFCWDTGWYIVNNNKEALTFLRDGVRKIRTLADVCIIRGKNIGGTKLLDDALLDGTVVFKPKKDFVLTDHVLSEERLRCGIKHAIEERKGFRLLPMEGFEFLSLFVHGYLNCWLVSDLHTGCRLITGSCRTKNTAVCAVKNCLRNTGRTKAKAAFNKVIKKYHCDLLADEKERIVKTENLSKENNMRLTKTDDKFDDPTGAVKPKKAVKRPKSAKNPKTLDKKATRQIVERTAVAKSVLKNKKQCSRCKKILPLTDFHKKTKSPDGKLGHCKVCECTYQKKRREARPDIPGKPAKATPKTTKKAAKKAAKKVVSKAAKRATRKAVKKTAR